MNKSEIREMWSQSSAEITAFFKRFDEATFSAKRQDRWSYAENLDHLVRSVKPVVFALRMPPKLLLRLLFGTSQTSSTYQEVHDDYKAKLQAGSQAPKTVIPKAVLSQGALLDQWESAATDLGEALDGWNEEQLDRLRLPHPILGRISIREMLYFTDVHVRHHLENCRGS